ncbi:hypothetical protein [Bradyrhizobium sp. BTAi1]|uniref:hypothetical protein n=1 Tax=Bradyrhizobium sp. (strain BTAi1 / ATCC BAA-1182) TaxID=288000 RepID=UPI0011D10ECB|nr:hypothetical protein [Bradyrhizobium sp. BTAi1]
MSDELPKWECNTAREKLAMTQWVNHQLNMMDLEELQRDLSGKNAIDPANYLEWAIEQADIERDIRPLKDALPYLARFLRLPKKGHGKRLPSRQYNPTKRAAEDVRRIRALWKQHYSKVKRTTEPSAESIAADRWDTNEEALFNELKKSHRRAKSPKRP